MYTGNMKTYNVAVPFTGVAYVTVEAENKKDAINKALMSEDLDFKNCEELEYHRQIVQGNVFHGCLNEAEAELEDGEDEE